MRRSNSKCSTIPIESPVSELRDDVTAALTKAVQVRYPDMSLSAYMESGATDGMHFRSAGVPTLAMSATIMNEEEMYAHGLNERILSKRSMTASITG